MLRSMSFVWIDGSVLNEKILSHLLHDGTNKKTIMRMTLVAASSESGSLHSCASTPTAREGAEKSIICCHTHDKADFTMSSCAGQDSAPTPTARKDNKKELSICISRDLLDLSLLARELHSASLSKFGTGTENTSRCPGLQGPCRRNCASSERQ